MAKIQEAERKSLYKNYKWERSSEPNCCAEIGGKSEMMGKNGVEGGVIFK